MAIYELSKEICPDIEEIRKEKLIHFICKEDMEALKIGREILKNRRMDLHKTEKKDN